MASFIESTFGTAETGTKYGGYVGILGGAGAGYAAGGIIGAIMGGLGGLVAAPLINEIFFRVGRSMGIITPPGRNNDIKPNVPTEEIPAPVIQPDKTFSKGSVEAPILDNIKPPPALTIADSFKKRERVWEMLVNKIGDRSDYDKAITEARNMEDAASKFILTVDKYEEVREIYHKPGGKREGVVNDVRTSLKRKGIENPLSEAEVQRFVPTLPALTSDEKAKVTALYDKAMPEQIPGFADLEGVDIRTFGYNSFVNDANDVPIPAKVEEWKAKSPIARIYVSLDALDNERFKFENGIDWTIIGDGDPAKGEEIRKKSAAEQLKYSIDNSKTLTDGRNDNPKLIKRTTHFAALGQFARIADARIKLQDYVKQNLDESKQPGQPDGVLGIYSKFSTDKLKPAAELAKEFAKQRLSVFNETGIAILEKGELAAEKSPAGKACQFMTYKDCAAPAGSPEITLVMQNDGTGTRVTHRIVGGLKTTTDWDKTKLNGNGVPVSNALFVKLEAENGKTIGANIRELLTSTTKARNTSQVALLMDSPEQDFKHLLNNPDSDLKLASADARHIPNLSSQPSSMLNNKEKTENPYAKKSAEVAV